MLSGVKIGYMTKPKQFVYKVEASLTQEQGEFLEDMVRKGEADNISQAMRNCVKDYMKNHPEVKG